MVKIKSRILPKKCRNQRDDGYIPVLAQIVGHRLVLDSPADLIRINEVEIRGALYNREVEVREVVRVAPRKFLDDHYVEVRELIDRGVGTMDAYQTVADKNGFDMDSFRKGYRKWFIRTQPS